VSGTPIATSETVPAAAYSSKSVTTTISTFSGTRDIDVVIKYGTSGTLTTATYTQTGPYSLDPTAASINNTNLPQTLSMASKTYNISFTGNHPNFEVRIVDGNDVLLWSSTPTSFAVGVAVPYSLPQNDQTGARQVKFQYKKNGVWVDAATRTQGYVASDAFQVRAINSFSQIRTTNSPTGIVSDINVPAAPNISNYTALTSRSQLQTVIMDNAANNVAFEDWLKVYSGFSKSSVFVTTGAAESMTDLSGRPNYHAYQKYMVNYNYSAGLIKLSLYTIDASRKDGSGWQSDIPEVQAALPYYYLYKKN
jgi:hypothetical protein